MFKPNSLLAGFIVGAIFMSVAFLMFSTRGYSVEASLFIAWLSFIFGWLVGVIGFYMYSGGWKRLHQAVKKSRKKFVVTEEEKKMGQELIELFENLPLNYRRDLIHVMAELEVQRPGRYIHIKRGAIEVEGDTLIINGKKYSFDPSKIAHVIRTWSMEE